MSTIKVTNIQHASASSAAIALNSDGQATLNGLNFPTAGPLSNRNLIINGAMQVAQRGTQVTGVTAAGYRTCDRFKFNVGTLGTWTVDQDTNAPNGFSNSLKLTCTTADASPAAGDQCFIVQKFEAQSLQSLGFGTSGAKALTLSFWVKSNKTGNASVAVLQTDNSNKLVSFQYSISSADTWEYKTIAIPADTSGSINNDNGEGLHLEWWLNSGSDFSGGSHQATWSTYDATNRNVSNLGVGGATSDNWAITGVQLEVGSVATPFEHRSYGDELARCHRYCYNPLEGAVTTGANVYIVNGFQFDGSTSYGMVHFPVTMRTEPSLTRSDLSHFQKLGPGSATTCTYLAIGGSSSAAVGTAEYNASGTAGQANLLRSASTSAVLRFEAEL